MNSTHPPTNNPLNQRKPITLNHGNTRKKRSRSGALFFLRSSTPSRRLGRRCHHCGHLHSWAQFKTRSPAIMATFFSLTAPVGIAIGIGISSVYNENGPTALIVEGIFDAASAGILIYMALVDLLAADFMNPSAKQLEDPTRSKCITSSRGWLYVCVGQMGLNF